MLVQASVLMAGEEDYEKVRPQLTHKHSRTRGANTTAHHNYTSQLHITTAHHNCTSRLHITTAQVLNIRSTTRGTNTSAHAATCAYLDVDKKKGQE